MSPTLGLIRCQHRSAAEGATLMNGPADARLRDDAALEEIEMTTNLMIAASESAGPLSQAQVDAALGLTSSEFDRN